MPNIKETLTKAYGNVPKEPVIYMNFDIGFSRPLRYYWLKMIRWLLKR